MLKNRSKRVFVVGGLIAVVVMTLAACGSSNSSGGGGSTTKFGALSQSKLKELTKQQMDLLYKGTYKIPTLAPVKTTPHKKIWEIDFGLGAGAGVGDVLHLLPGLLLVLLEDHLDRGALDVVPVHEAGRADRGG